MKKRFNQDTKILFIALIFLLISAVSFNITGKMAVTGPLDVITTNLSSVKVDDSVLIDRVGSSPLDDGRSPFIISKPKSELCGNNMCDSNEYFLKINEKIPATTYGKEIMLLNVGSGGDVVVNVGGEIAVVQKEREKIVNTISIENLETYYEDNFSKRKALLLVGETYLSCPEDCEEKIECIDTDITEKYPDGKNYFMKGGTKVTGTLESFKDSCILLANLDWAVTEYYCAEEGKIEQEIKTCLNGCEDGACKEAECTKDEDCDSGYECVDYSCVKERPKANIKDLSKYSSKEVFLISDKNWKDVLPLVPITTWTDNKNNIHKYPTLIYLEEEEVIKLSKINYFDVDSTIHFIQQYNTNKLTIVGKTPQELDNLLIADPELGAGLKESQIQRINPKNYLFYWQSYEDIVYVENDYKLALLASTYASLLNAPLIIQGTINDVEDTFTGRNIICIGSVSPKGVECAERYSAERSEQDPIEKLQKAHLEKTNTDKIILVNPNDLKVSYSKLPLYTERSSSFNPTLFDKHSLAAPFLAAAKKELIIFTDASVLSPDAESGCAISSELIDNLVKTVSSIKKSANRLGDFSKGYLTIVAAPNSIPDSILGYKKGRDKVYGFSPTHSEKFFIPFAKESKEEMRYCTDTGTQYRTEMDLYYGVGGLGTWSVGRIYGLTVSDVSSYIARSVFYNELFENIYGDSYTGMSIARSIEGNRYGANTITTFMKLKGYGWICDVDSSRFVVCGNRGIPPIEDYERRQFITFGDHGSKYSWHASLSTWEIPWLDLTYAPTDACSTSNFWQGKEDTFSVNFVRKGGIGYHGSVGITFTQNPYIRDDCDIPRTVMEVLSNTNGDVPLGSLQAVVGDCNYFTDHYTLIGDPTLKLKLNKVPITWGKVMPGELFK